MFSYWREGIRMTRGRVEIDSFPVAIVNSWVVDEMSVGNRPDENRHLVERVKVVNMPQMWAVLVCKGDWDFLS